MNVRLFQPEDFGGVVSALKRLHRKTPYRDFDFDDLRVRHTLAQCLNSKLMQAWVVTQDGKVRGVLIGVIDKLWWSSTRYATDLVLYSEVHSGARRMVAAFVAWAKQHGAAEITMGQSSGIRPDESERLYLGLNFERVGGMFLQLNPDAVKGGKVAA